MVAAPHVDPLGDVSIGEAIAPSEGTSSSRSVRSGGIRFGSDEGRRR